MPLGASTRRNTGTLSGTVFDGKFVKVNVEQASGIPFDGVPDWYKRRMMRSLKAQLKRNHLPTVLKELKKGNNEETYDPKYAAQKSMTNVNVRSIKGLISGKKRYTAQGPVDFIRSGQLYNSLVTDVRIKGDAVISRIVVGKDSRSTSSIGNRQLVDILDRTKNIREHATEAVRKNQDTLIIGSIKKAINKAARAS